MTGTKAGPISGATWRACFNTSESVENAGFVPKRRNMHYEVLGDPIFRERDVPRLLALATARDAGDTSVPVELRNYAARSRAGKELRLTQ